MEEKERIEHLSNLFGPSGFEDEVSDFVRSELKELSLHQDHMRNLSGAFGTDGPLVMLDAHLDEVGLIVQAIKPDGTMRFLTLGRMAPEAVAASSFRIRTDKGTYIPAVVACKPPHFRSALEKNMPLDISSMVLDCGTSSKEETEALGISIGSPAAPDVVCRYDGNLHRFYGKAFDCRIGVAAEIETLKRLEREGFDHLSCRVGASFAVQEEVGERGVLVNASRLQPDVMICFEGCPADDTFSEDYMVQAALGKGPMLRNMDVSMITNWRFQKFAVDLAKQCGIPVQQSVRAGGGTNAAAVNSRFGTPAIVIGIPVRYIHSPNCFVDERDYENAVKLAVALVHALTASNVGKL